jgi:hypothetical protein
VFLLLVVPTMSVVVEEVQLTVIILLVLAVQVVVESVELLPQQQITPRQ